MNQWCNNHNCERPCPWCRAERAEQRIAELEGEKRELAEKWTRDMKKAGERITDEEERHAILQTRCYEGFPSATDGIFTALEVADQRIAELEREREEARKVLRCVAHWREHCHTYDDDINDGDVDQRRAFVDAEEWDRVEVLAHAALGEEEK